MRVLATAPARTTEGGAVGERLRSLSSFSLALSALALGAAHGVAALSEADPFPNPLNRQPEKPAWETDEYARIRFTFVCTSAARFPITSEAAAITASVIVQRWASCGNATRSTRKISTSAAALVAAAMNAVTGVGDPWYTSGVHW